MSEPSDAEKKKLADDLKKAFADLQKQNEQLMDYYEKSQEFFKGEGGELLSYMDNLGIKNKKEFVQFYQKENKKQPQKETKEEDVDINKLKEAMKEVMSPVEKRMAALEAKSGTVLENVSKKSLEENFNKADAKKIPYINAYLKTLKGEEKQEQKKEILEMMESLMEDQDVEFEDALEAMEDDYKKSYGNFLKIEEKPEGEGEKEVKSEDDGIKIPDSTANSVDGKSPEGEKKAQEEREKMSDSEKLAADIKEAQANVEARVPQKP